MPHNDALAIRTDAKITQGQAHRLVFFFALSDITARHCHPSQWTHPQAAQMLCVGEGFTALVRDYLTYRRALTSGRLDRARQLDFHGKASAVLTDRGQRRDLLQLPQGDDKARLAALLQRAVTVGASISPHLAAQAETLIGDICGSPWEQLMESFAAQRAATARRPARLHEAAA